MRISVCKIDQNELALFLSQDGEFYFCDQAFYGYKVLESQHHPQHTQDGDLLHNRRTSGLVYRIL